MPKITKAKGPTHNPRSVIVSAPDSEGASAPPAAPDAIAAAHAEPTERPAKSARVADWRAYAETVGVDTDGMTKAQIIAAVDGG